MCCVGTGVRLKRSSSADTINLTIHNTQRVDIDIQIEKIKAKINPKVRKCLIALEEWAWIKVHHKLLKGADISGRSCVCEKISNRESMTSALSFPVNQLHSDIIK